MSTPDSKSADRPARCPICRRTFDLQASRAAPFCSERCRLVDLGRWIDERYAAPVSREPEEPWPNDG